MRYIDHDIKVVHQPEKYYCYEAYVAPPVDWEQPWMAKGKTEAGALAAAKRSIDKRFKPGGSYSETNSDGPRHRRQCSR